MLARHPNARPRRQRHSRRLFNADHAKACDTVLHIQLVARHRQEDARTRRALRRTMENQARDVMNHWNEWVVTRDVTYRGRSTEIREPNDPQYIDRVEWEMAVEDLNSDGMIVRPHAHIYMHIKHHTSVWLKETIQRLWWYIRVNHLTLIGWVHFVLYGHVDTLKRYIHKQEAQDLR